MHLPGLAENRSRAIQPQAPTIRVARLDLIITLVLALGGWRSGLSTLCDNSFFCHLRTGQWILEHGVPRSDVFSFTVAGSPWVAESWLADAIYGATDRAAGLFGIMLLNAAVGAAIGALWYRLALRLSRDRVRALLLTLASLGASWTVWSPRPLLFGILALLTLVWIVEVPDSAAGRKPLIAIPPLMWLWANIHGTFALGFVFVGLHCIGRWLEGAPPWDGRERRLITAALIGFALCFINPYGPSLLTAPLHLLARHRVLANVAEWRAPSLRSVQGRVYVLWLVVLTACCAAGWARVKRRDVVVGVPFLLLGFWAFRNVAIAPIVTISIASRAVAASDERPDPRFALNWVLTGALVVLGAWWTARAALGPKIDFSSYPVAAMQVVEAEGLLGRRLLSTDKWGDFLILRYWPRQRVFTDDRYDLYPLSIGDDLVPLLNDRGDWHRVLARYAIDVVVWPHRRVAIEALSREPGWKLVYEDRIAVVFARGISAASANLGAPQPSR